MQLADVAAATPEALTETVKGELSKRHRLLPHRWDYADLLGHAGEVAHLVKGMAGRGAAPARGDVVFAQKGWRGSRPLTVMALPDAVAYRHLCALLTARLPEHLRRRSDYAEFKRVLLDEPGVTHIAVTDVTAYYEFVDHELLADELVAQTGDEPIVEQLLSVTAGVMGRNVGLPQIHDASDILGDIYIDRVRRRMRRRGYPTVAYSDDFRIGASSLSDARRTLELCAAEMRRLGLVMNERKTFTYSTDAYRRDLEELPERERELFVGSNELLAFFEDQYDDTEPTVAPTSFSADPITMSDEETDFEVSMPDGVYADLDVSAALVLAAEAAFASWERTRQLGAEPLSDKEASFTQTFLGKALAILGDAGSGLPLRRVVDILRFEPSLTPKLASYLVRYAQASREARREVRDALDTIVESPILSDWQGVWIAYVASYLGGSASERAHVKWLRERVSAGPDVVAAHAAAALGAIGRGDAGDLAAGVGRIGPAWRSLALWGLVRIDARVASQVAGPGIERLLLPAWQSTPMPEAGPPRRVARRIRQEGS